MTHNSDTTNFSIFSDKLSDVGTYEVSVVSTIEVPKDFKKATSTTMTSQVDFTITVNAVCGSTSFIDWALHEKLFISTVKGKVIVGEMGPVLDTVSQINGNKDGLTFCGDRVYRVVDNTAVSSFLTLSNDD